MSPRPGVALLAVLALTTLLAPAAAAADHPVPAGETHVVIQVEADGDARWTVTTGVAVADERDREAFRSLAEDHENGDRPAPWLDQVRRASDAASAATGRSMNVTDVNRSSDVANGTLSVSFTWTNFATRDGERLVVGDAFNTSSGTWLDGLTANQALIVDLPEGYGVVSAPQGSRIESARVRWDGPASFEPGYLRVVASGEATTPTPSDTSPVGPSEGLGPWVWRGVLAGLLATLAIGAYLLSRRASDDDADGSGPVTEDDGPSPPPEPAAPDTDPGEAGHPAGVDPSPDPVDETLLSDEERVEQLLEENGGRMKQASIVKETDWSNAKVSQLLSAMEEEGRIDKLRIGRENLISFPDEDVADVGEE